MRDSFAGTANSGTAARSARADAHYRRPTRALTRLLSCLLLASCRAPDPTRTDGIPLVEVDVGDPEPATLPAALVSDVRCSTAPDPDDCGPEVIESVAADSANVFVNARGGLFVVRGDSADRLARNGRGPGELAAPIAVGLAEGTGVVVFDIARLRTIHFVERGRVQESPTAPPPAFAEARIGAGRVLALVRPAGQQLGDPVTSTVVRYDSARARWSDTLASFDDRAASRVGDSGSLPPLPWDRKVFWAPCSDGGILVGASDAWGFDRFVGGRRVGRVRAKALPRRPMSTAEHQRLMREALESAPQMPQFREVLARRLAAKPDYEPAMDGLLCVAGSIAVVTRYRGGAGGPAVVDVIDTTGVRLGSFGVPADIELHDGVSLDRVMGIVRSRAGDRVVQVRLPARER